MSFADLESGALPAPRKARGPDATRALVFQITTAVASYRRLLNSLGTPKDTPTLRRRLLIAFFNWQRMRKISSGELLKQTRASKLLYTTDDRSADSGKMPEQRALLAESKRREVLQLDNEIVFNEAIIEEREQVEDIQRQIDCVKDLATLVHAQGVIIAATKEAKTEIVKASKLRNQIHPCFACFW